MKAGLLKKFTVFDLVLLTMMAVLGVAIKPFIVPLAQIITGPLYIPGGVVAGGFYMLWIILGCGLVDKRGAGTLIGIIQAILVIALGIYGSHGVASILTYIAPGIFVDLLYIILRGGVRTSIHALLGGVVANVTGTVLVSFVFFRLPLIPLLLSLAAASLSGAMGGLIAFALLKYLKKFNIGLTR